MYLLILVTITFLLMKLLRTFPECNQGSNYISFAVEGTSFSIDMMMTIFFGVRIIIRDSDDMYVANWCAGNNQTYQNIGLNAAIKICKMLESKEIYEEDVPFQSKTKPFYNDEKFMNWLMSIELDTQYDITDIDGLDAINVLTILRMCV